MSDRDFSGDELILSNKISSGLYAYIFDGENQKFKFIMNTGSGLDEIPMHKDLVYITALANNIELYEYLVMEKKMKISKKTLDYIFDNADVDFIERAMADDIWKNSVHDAGLVTSVSIIDHFKRYQTGQCKKINTIFKDWGPFDTRIFYNIITSSDEEVLYFMKEKNLVYINDKILIDLLLVLPLSIRKYVLSQFDIDYITKHASISIIMNMLKLHPYVSLSNSNINNIIKKNNVEPGITDLKNNIDIIITFSEDIFIRHIYKKRGFDVLANFLKYF